MDEYKERLVLGSILKLCFSQYDLSQAEVAQRLGISRQNVSHIINGKISTTPLCINNIFSILDTDLRFDFRVAAKVNYDSMFLECLKMYFYEEIDECINLLNTHLRKEHFYSYYSIKYQILDLLNDCLNKNAHIEKKISTLKTFFYNIMDDDEKMSFLTISANYYVDINEYDAAFDLLADAEKLASSCVDFLKGIIFKLKGTIYYFRLDAISALEYDQRASLVFHKLHNYCCSISLLINLGTDYAQLRKYDKAIEWFKKALRRSQQIGRKDSEHLAYRNLTFTSYLNGSYEDAICYGKKLLSIDEEGISTMIWLSWSYYLSDNTEKAKRYCDMIVSKKYGNENVVYRKYMVQLLRYYFNDRPSKDKIVKLQKMLQCLGKNSDLNDRVWCLEMMIMEFEKIHDYKAVCTYQKELLKLYHIYPMA